MGCRKLRIDYKIMKIMKIMYQILRFWA